MHRVAYSPVQHIHTLAHHGYTDSPELVRLYERKGMLLTVKATMGAPRGTRKPYLAVTSLESPTKVLRPMILHVRRRR
jgi:hypothetical protein